MYSRTDYIRRSRKTELLKKRVAVVALVGVAGCAAAVALLRGPGLARAASDTLPVPAASAAAAAAQPLAAAPATAAQPAARRIYPYSIVPGGLANGADVRRVVGMDGVVAAHYAGFDADKARLVTVDKPRAVYVSYRKGDKVFWTAGKHTLAVGESVLTDGKNELRARCGNRISDTPQFPVETHGPSERELDAATVAAAEPSAEGGLQNVSLDPELGGGGQGWKLSTFENAAGLARPAAEARARGGIGLPAAPGIDMPSLFDGRRLLASAVEPAGNGAGDSGTGGSGGSGAPAGNAPGAGMPASGGAAGDTQPSTPGAPGGGLDGAPVDPAKPGSGNGGDAGTPGSSGGSGPGAPGQSPQAGDGSSGPQPGGGSGAPTDLPVVLLPTDPVLVPAKPDEPGKGHTDVPEPGTLWLGGLAFAAMLFSRRRKH